VYNLKNANVIGNLPMYPHLYAMKDGTFKFEDETNCLSDESYDTFREVRNAFYKYSAELCIGSYRLSKTDPIEVGRRLFLADALRGLRNAINHLIHSTDNAEFHKRNMDAMDAAGKTADGLSAYIGLLDPENVPF